MRGQLQGGETRAGPPPGEEEGGDAETAHASASTATTNICSTCSCCSYKMGVNPEG